jgi:hypothetical protein
VTQPTDQPCSGPIPFDALIAYSLGELSAAAEAPLELHVFGCAHCTQRLEELAALADGVRTAVAGGRVGVVVSRPFVEAMRRSGLRVREYDLGPTGSVNCTIHADDDAVVSRLTAPLAGVKRVDAVQYVQVGADKGPEVRQEDVPFDPGTGELFFMPPADWLKSMPAMTLRKRLFAVDDGGERLIGEYAFFHTPQ